MAEKFDIETSVVVLVRMQDGHIEEWNRLDKVWALWDDEPAFADYVRSEIEQMLTLEPIGARNPSPATGNLKATMLWLILVMDPLSS